MHIHTATRRTAGCTQHTLSDTFGGFCQEVPRPLMFFKGAVFDVPVACLHYIGSTSAIHRRVPHRPVTAPCMAGPFPYEGSCQNLGTNWEQNLANKARYFGYGEL